MDAFVGKISKLETHARAGEVSELTVREAIEDFMIRDCQPFTVVESTAFLTLLKVCLNCSKKDVFIPKSDAMKDGIMKRVAKFKVDLVERLHDSGATKFHLALDGWTSSNCYNFLALTCTFLDKDWHLCEELLSFDDLCDHSGDSLEEVVLDVLQKSQISDKIGCITADNATNNDTLCIALSELLNEKIIASGSSSLEIWDALQCRIRCFPHIINLACKAFLSGFQPNDTVSNDFDNPPTEGDSVSISNLLQRISFAIKKLRSSPSQK